MYGNPPLTAEEAAHILKISKYTFYELVKRGDIPVQRVGRQMRIDPDALDRYLSGSANPGQPYKAAETAGITAVHGPALSFTGSHDPVIDLLREFLQHSMPPVTLSVSFTGSMEGLIALFKRQADMAGIHLWDDKTEDYNLPFVRYMLPGEPATVINLVQRIQGWLVAPGNPLQLGTWNDIAKPGLRFINRQKGSGTRMRVDDFLRKARISPASVTGYDREETTHFGVACRVANGEADAGIGVQSAAATFGLDFIPLFHERYDIACLQETTRTPQYQQLVSVLKSAPFHHAVHCQAGYDTSLTGKIITQSNKS